MVTWRASGPIARRGTALLFGEVLFVFNCSVLSFRGEIKNPSEQNPSTLHYI
jgi:hypothetical protein